MAADTVTGTDPSPGTGTSAGAELDRTLHGLDALVLAGRANRSPLAARAWAATWPKALALGIVVGVWQLVALSGWRPSYILPPPAEVFGELRTLLSTGDFWQGLAMTLRRAGIGFVLATAIGLVIGVAVARIAVLRAAFGSMITALQTMPSIAWFPVAILLLKLTENAIAFVVVIGAAPAIANGVIAGVDFLPPLLLRAGKNMGARGLALYRYVIAPASLPAIVAGLKQGWAFAWRSLMAGELLVIVPGHPSIGAQMQIARDLNQASTLFAIIIVIFAIGISVDVVFNAVNRAVRRRWGVADPGT